MFDFDHGTNLFTKEFFMDTTYKSISYKITDNIFISRIINIHLNKYSDISSEKVYGRSLILIDKLNKKLVFVNVGFIRRIDSHLLLTDNFCFVQIFSKGCQQPLHPLQAQESMLSKP